MSTCIKKDYPTPYLNSVCPIYIAISNFTYVRPYGFLHPASVSATCPVPSHFTIPAAGSQNVTNKNCLVFVKSEKYAFWVTLRLIGSMRQGKA